MAKAKKSTATTSANAIAFVIVNGQQIDIDVSAVALETLISDMVEKTRSEYGAHIRMAAKLNELLPFAWFDVEHHEKSDNATALEPHKKLCLDGFKAAGHSNPSVPYKRMRDYGRNLRAGLAPNGKTLANGDPLPEGEGEGEGEGANPAKRSPVVRNVDDLVALYKHNEKLGDKAPAPVAKAQPHIIAALAALGVDIRTIK